MGVGLGKFLEQLHNRRGPNRGFKIQIEQELKRAAPYGAAFKLGEVEPKHGELGDHGIQRAGLVGDGQHEADFI